MALKAAVSNRIMQSFYHPHLREYGTKAGLPHILGLTASPIASRVKQMEDLQKNLHARCKTPQLHHEELMRHVHRPKLELLPVTDEKQPASRFIEALDECVYCYDIQADPDVRWLKTRRSDRHKRELEKIFSGKKQTHCQEQLKAFRNRAQHLHENLGPWASHRYIYTCLQRLKQVEVNEHMIAHDWECERDLFLQRTLARLGPVPPPPGLPDKISNKVEVLLKILTLQYTPGLSCVIFVQQRACAKLLSDLLSLHPQTSQIIRPTSIIGDARHAKRKERFDVFDPDEQKNAVQGFKDKKSNLIVATSVLEEGIDVSACHLVITFDELSNLRSFIQRRGRARKSGSTFAVFATEQSKLEWLGQLEQLMKVMYADDLARAKELEAAEDIDEDEYDGIFSDTG
ncbi:Dicer-like protein 2 [Ascosphaera atra]|nr:Dicer-like protein 2 [Ascosphaera atra]